MQTRVGVGVCLGDIATRVLAGRPRIVGSAPGTRNKYFLDCKASIQPHIHRFYLAVSCGLEQTVRVADQSPPSRAEVNSSWHYHLHHQCSRPLWSRA